MPDMWNVKASDRIGLPELDAENFKLDDTEIIRRIIDRGMKRAQERKDSEFIDIFQHLKDELERVKI